MRNRRIAIALVALALLVAAVRHPSATITLATADATDPAPHRFQAAVDIGLMAVSVIVTWTSKHLSDAR
ncbi:hypothetical protein ACLB0R_09005 [Sphingomonas sp. GlSt437]|uniref:hypothetical protein n=1 Tax=Sphingomonas sp. GlSt437 TaxID=3389970 RepID=UPI003A89DFFF